jgi:hypothetical protein
MVTPHLSTPPEVAASVAVVALLCARPLWEAAGRVVARDRAAPLGELAGAGAPTARGRMLGPASVALSATAVAALAAAGLELCWALARTHHGHDAVTGAYLATLSVFGLLTWAASGGRAAG